MASCQRNEVQVDGRDVERRAAAAAALDVLDHLGQADAIDWESNTWPPLTGNPLCELTDSYRVPAVNEVAGTKLPPVVVEDNWVGVYVAYPGPPVLGRRIPPFPFSIFRCSQGRTESPSRCGKTTGSARRPL